MLIFNRVNRSPGVKGPASEEAGYKPSAGPNTLASVAERQPAGTEANPESAPSRRARLQQPGPEP